MYKSVKAYLDAVKKADAAKEERDKAAAEAYNAAVAASNGDYEARSAAAEVQRVDARQSMRLREAQEQAAWYQLSFAQEPTVRWIARNCDGYKEHARICMRALKEGSTAEDMRKLARRSSWCGTFDELLYQAKLAGVFADEVSAERLAFYKWLSANAGLSERSMAQVEIQLNSVLESEGGAMVSAALETEVSARVAEALEAATAERMRAVAGAAVEAARTASEALAEMAAPVPGAVEPEVAVAPEPELAVAA